MAGPIATLAVRLSAQIAEFQESFKQSTKTLDDFKREFGKFAPEIERQLAAAAASSKKFGDSFEGIATRAAAVGSFVGNIAADMAKSLAGAFIGFGKDAIQQSQEFNNAFIGLSSSAKAFGVDVEKAKAAAKGLSADGLLPLKDSATGLKNLFAAGFGLDQSVKLMEAFKDSAAFGRQSSLSFGDAVRSATEGIKNQNSAVVDNAGVTKNLSVILKEAGFELQDLSDKTKGIAARQALYSGILRETAAQQGDAAKAANTFSGQLAALDTAWTTLKATIGDAITQNQTVTTVFGELGKALRGITADAADNQKAFLLVSDTVIALVRSFALLIDGLNLTQKAFGTLQVASNEFFRRLLADALLTTAALLDFAQGLLLPAEAIRPLKDGVIFLTGAITGLEEASRDARDRQTGWSSSLEAISTRANTLANELVKTRGQVVAFGDDMAKKPGGDDPAGLGKATGSAKAFGASLAKLTAEINEAVAHQATLAEMVELFGSQASKASDKAHAWGISVTASVERVATAFEQLAAKKEILTIVGDVDALDRRLKAFSTKEMQDEMRDLAKQSKDAIESIADRLEKFGDTFEREMFRLTQIRPFTAGLPGMFGGGGLGFTVGDLNSFGLFGKKAGAEFTNAFRTSAANFAQQLPQALQTAVQAMQTGNTIGAIAGFGGGLGAAFIQTFTDAAARAAKDGGAGVTIGETIAGQIGIGLASFAQGAQMAQVMGRFAGSLTGALAGALQGAALAGPAGAAVGPGGRPPRRPDGAESPRGGATRGPGLPIGLRGQLGGAAKIQEIAARMPAFEEAVRRAFTTVEVDKFNAAVGDINIALEEYNARLKGLATAQTAVNARTALYTDQFKDLIEKRTALLAGRPPELLSGDEGRKLSELQAQIGTIAARTQPEFERLGVIVASTFGGIVKQTGDGFAAIKALAPSFQALKDGVTEFGAGSTPVIDKLLGQFDLIQSEITGPFLEAVQSSGQILRGLFDAKSLDPAGFQALAADIGQNLQEVANRGGDMAQAFALSQPVLQTLLEAQQQFGAITDDTTKGILAQAEAQGIVGNQFKSTQQKTLEVLLAIADVFGAKIPEGIAATTAAATTAGAAIGSAFSTGVEAAGASVGGFADKIRTQIPPAAADAAAAMRRALEIQAFNAGVTVTATMSNAAIESAIALSNKIGSGLIGLGGQAKKTADDISATFGRIKVPEIIIPAKVELDSSAIDRIPDDVRIRTGFETDGIPSFGTGAIVRKRTLAFVGESGPEAIVPLSGSGGMQPEGMRVIFEQDGRAAAEFLVPHIPGVVQRYRLA